MKLERLHESVPITVTIMVGLALAVLGGAVAGSGQMGKVAMILAFIVALGMALAIRESAWLLIPATGMLGGRLIVLPLPFSVDQIGILFAFGMFLLLKAFKIVRLKPKVGLVEVWMWFTLIYVATVFMRNPVGVEAFGSERVGGRPYINIVIAYLACWVLSRAVASPRQAFFLPLLVVAGHACLTLVNLVAFRFPAALGLFSSVYSGLAADEQNVYATDPTSDSTRQSFWQGIATATFVVACSFWRPITLVNPAYFWRFLVFLFSLYAVFLSGFRSAFIAMAMFFLASSYFRRGFMEVARTAIPGGLALGLLLILQGNVIDLPYSAQRTLSFLPGRWDPVTKSEAEGSTQWRVDMWKTVLSGNRYISNKWLGDGFGFTRNQLDIMRANTQAGSPADIQENFMISGTLHSGPVSSIRFVGYLGLALFLVLLGLIAHRAVQLIRRAERTAFYPLALYLGVSMVLHPVMFIFVFGAFESDLPGAVMNVGFLKLLENSLNAFEVKQPVSPVVAVEPRRSFRRPPQFVPAGRLG